VTTPIISDGRLIMRAGRLRQDIGRRLDDVVLLLLIVFLIPLAIVVIGSPVALFVRLLIEIAQRY
jgi:hypothetical protein